MGKNWIFILKHSGYNEIWDDFELYVGETSRLYRSFNEHLEGRGAESTTSFNNDITLVGLYDANNNSHFMRYHGYKLKGLDCTVLSEWAEKSDCYDSFECKNKITERLYLLLDGESGFGRPEFLETGWCDSIKGGKYTKKNIKFNKEKIDIEIIEDRPICKCGFPSEVFLSKKGEIWFKCCISNTTWINFSHKNFIIGEPCNFLKKYDMK